MKKYKCFKKVYKNTMGFIDNLSKSTEFMWKEYKDIPLVFYLLALFVVISMLNMAISGLLLIVFLSAILLASGIKTIQDIGR